MKDKTANAPTALNGQTAGDRNVPLTIATMILWFLLGDTTYRLAGKLWARKAGL